MEIAKKIQFFFLSSMLFSYYILMSTYLSSSLAGQSISLLVAPTYFAFAVALAVGFFVKKIKKFSGLNSYLSFLTLISFIISILLINSQIKNLIQDILRLGAQKNKEMHFLEFYVSSFYAKYSFTISALMSLPFFCYGLFFTNYLDSQKINGSLRTLFLELIGGATGVLLSLIALNYCGWESTFIYFFCFTGLGCLLFYYSSKKYILISLTIILMGSVLFLQNILSPISNLHISGRDFANEAKVELLRESWNSFSRVQTLKINYNFNNQDYAKKVISIGDGTGHAQMPGLNMPERSFTSELTTFFKPKKVLVLFAGAGYEIVKMSEALHPPEEITGVEINSHVIEHGQLGSDGAMAAVLKNKKYHLVQADARQFLEKSTEQYDSILFSWSGATVAYYTGAIMHTTQYVFTREAFKAAYNRLASGGRLIIFGGSKINIINHMRALGINELKNKLTLVVPKYDPSWKKSWDNTVLIISKYPEEKNDSFGDFLKLLKRFGYRVVMSPFFETDEKYRDIENLIQDPNWPEALQALNFKDHVNFKSHTDDNPFVYRMFPNYAAQELSNIPLQIMNLHYGVKDLILVVTIFSILVLGLSFYFNRSSNVGGEVLAPLLSFGFGIFSTSLLLFSIYKSVLFLGFPNFALGLGMLVSMSSSLFGFYFVQKIKLNDKLFLAIQLLGISLLMGLIFLSYGEYFKYFIFQIHFVLQALLLYLVFFIIFSLNSLFYPYLVFRNQKNLTLTKQIIAFDVVGSGLGSLILPLLIEDHGISLIMALSTACLLAMSLIWIIFKKASPEIRA